MAGDATPTSAQTSAAISAETEARRVAYESSPLAVMVVGFAGSGKSTLVQRISSHYAAKALAGAPAAVSASANGDREDCGGGGGGGGGAAEAASTTEAAKPPYVLNLDPAVHSCPNEANIDIRDTLSHRGVMSQYGLGPNGAIVTALNLYATRFHEVVALLERRRDEAGVVLVDTPGQIECFTWSASGQIIADALASTMPCCVLFVVDGPRCENSPRTFMSNMLQACSILYKMNLPIVLAFNKSDACDISFARLWMDDFEAFLSAMDTRERDCNAADLSRSLCLVLDEFYNGLAGVPVSATTGEGMHTLEAALESARQEYIRDYLPELLAKRAANAEREEARQERDLERVRADVETLTPS